MYEIKKSAGLTHYILGCIQPQLDKSSIRYRSVIRVSVASLRLHLSNPLQANEVSAVWGRAATFLILAAQESLALMMRPRCRESETGENRSVNNNRKVYHPGKFHHLFASLAKSQSALCFEVFFWSKKTKSNDYKHFIQQTAHFIQWPL